MMISPVAEIESPDTAFVGCETRTFAESGFISVREGSGCLSYKVPLSVLASLVRDGELAIENLQPLTDEAQHAIRQMLRDSINENKVIVNNNDLHLY